MTIIVDVERKGSRELSGGFRVSGRKVNLWVRIYDTEFGRRVRITMSYHDGVRWVNTPPIWLNKDLCVEVSERLRKISEKLT